MKEHTSVDGVIPNTKLSWELTPQPETKQLNNSFDLRSWQKEAFTLFEDHPFMIVNAPMGAGKSFLINAVSTSRMIANERLKTIIAVPQAIIASGFVHSFFNLPGINESIDWTPQLNLCQSTPRSNVKQLIDMLDRPRARDMIDDGVAICTHASLVMLYKELRDQGRLDLFDNTLVWIDEAHHLKNVEVEDEDEQIISNVIGELVNQLIQDRENTQVGLVTASFFRGDRFSLLTDAAQSQFVRYNLPFDEYLITLKYLTSFSYSFMMAGRNYIGSIRKLLEHQRCKDIIYLPHPNSVKSEVSKYEMVQEILAQYQEIYGGEYQELSNGVTLLTGGEVELKILNLVEDEPSIRRVRKDYLINNLNSKDSLDVIIALNMFKEGANWNWAERTIICGPRNSLVDIFQTFGRLLRDAEGKESVETIHLLPFILDEIENSDEFRNELNDYLKAVYASLILENIIAPIRLNPRTENNGTREKTQTVDYLTEALPYDSDQHELVKQAMTLLLNLSVLDPEASEDVDSLRQIYYEKLEEVLEEWDVYENQKEIAEQIWNLGARRSFQMKGLTVNEINFDLLQKTHPLDFLIHYTTGACGLDTLAKLREAIIGVNDPEGRKAALIAMAKADLPCPQYRKAA